MNITERGQVTIPKKLRERYGIRPETELDMVETEEGILIVKRLAASPFRKLVGRANAVGLPQHTDQFIALLRDGDESK